MQTSGMCEESGIIGSGLGVLLETNRCPGTGGIPGLMTDHGAACGDIQQRIEMATPDDRFPSIDFTTIGPAVGERFPDVVLPDQTGRAVDLHAVRGNRRALILFYRSARW